MHLWESFAFNDKHCVAIHYVMFYRTRFFMETSILFLVPLHGSWSPSGNFEKYQAWCPDINGERFWNCYVWNSLQMCQFFQKWFGIVEMLLIPSQLQCMYRICHFLLNWEMRISKTERTVFLQNIWIMFLKCCHLFWLAWCSTCCS